MTTVGRIVFALPFVVFGINHLVYAKAMAGMVPSFIPGGVFWVYFTGLALIAAGVAIIAQKFAKLAAVLLSALLGFFIVTLHIPGMLNPQTMQMSMISLLKDVAMAGGALVIASVVSE
ncbi:MAG TPA: DoxX family protein [bacterium]|nr:DoxX family protein [bacterium]HPR86719.1 DoxX family protein [bacterium]